MTPARKLVAGTAGILLLGSLLSLLGSLLSATPAQAAPAQSPVDRSLPAGPVPAPNPSAPSDTVAPAARDKVLPAGWRTSEDRLWTTSGDANGFHVLTATAKTGYTWETAASLSEPGFDADSWLGNACLTGSGRRVVVVYAPRTFTNKADLFDRGGFTAVVDLDTHVTTKLPVQSSLAYFNPGCGTGETAAISQFDGREHESPKNRTTRSRLFTIDAAKARLSKPILLNTELSSPVPVKDGIVAAAADGLVSISATGRIARTAPANGVPFRLAPEASGGVLFIEKQGADAHVKRAQGTRATELASGAADAVGLARGDGDPAGQGPQQIADRAPNPKLGATTSAPKSAPKANLKAAAAGSSSDPVEADRYCSVPRNDPANQAVQPKPRNVEWAVDQAVFNKLDQVASRPANWKGYGMPAYAPQTLFRPIDLVPTGHVPPQIMLGIITQESNMWQASRYALPGVPANPLMGNYYGREIYNSTTVGRADRVRERRHQLPAGVRRKLGRHLAEISDWLPAKLEATYRAIHRAAPNAKIYVMGYPQMFPDEEGNDPCYNIGSQSRLWLNSLAGRLAATTALAVDDVKKDGVDIRFVNSTLKFRIGADGDKHWACGGTSGRQWLNDITSPTSDGSGDNTPGTGSWHPTKAGAQAMADILELAFRGDSPVGAVKQRILDYVATRSGDRWVITDRQAQLAAQRCLDLARRGGLAGDPCMTVPILFPTAFDAAGAAANDEGALNANPPWVLGNRMTNDEKGKVLSRGWMNAVGTGAAICPSPRPGGLQCDEFPFYTSEQGGAWDSWKGSGSPVSTKLALIPEGENNTRRRT